MCTGICGCNKLNASITISYNMIPYDKIGKTNRRKGATTSNSYLSVLPTTMPPPNVTCIESRYKQWRNEHPFTVKKKGFNAPLYRH